MKQHSSFKHPKLQNEVLDVSQRTHAQKEEPSVDSEMLASSGGREGNETEDTELENQKPEEIVKSDKSKYYNCQYCSYSTNFQSSMCTHMRKKHADTRMFRCNHCNNRFGSNMHALRHHRWKHPSLIPDVSFLEHNEGASTNDPSDEEGPDAASASSESFNRKSPRHIQSQDLPKKTLSRMPSHSRVNSPTRSRSVSGSSLSSSVENSQAVAKTNTESQVVYSCCHCNHKSSKEVMEDHMKKQHWDMPYQVRREEADKVFTEVYIYKCIHCIVESISHAQSMDHWIQNHALLEFKYQMVLRHSGEVSNQVVTSTTADKDPVESSASDKDKGVSENTRTSVADSEAVIESPSSSVITSSSESVSTSVNKPLPISKRRGSNVDMTSPLRYSFDTEEEDQSEWGDAVDEEAENNVQSSSDVESHDMMYKCGYCKKSSSKSQDIDAHLSKVSSLIL